MVSDVCEMCQYENVLPPLRILFVIRHNSRALYHLSLVCFLFLVGCMFESKFVMLSMILRNSLIEENTAYFLCPKSINNESQSDFVLEIIDNASVH